MLPPTSIVRVWWGRPSAGGEYRGTAFFIEPNRALTAKHVVDPAHPGPIYLQVGWNGVSEVAVHSVARHPGGHVDVALLTIDRQSAAPVSDLIRIVDVPESKVGDSLILFGFPDKQSGIEVRPALITNIESVATALVTDPLPSPGMSGGPATTADHVLRGINWAKDIEKGRGYLTPFSAFRQFLIDQGIDLSQPACPYPGLASFTAADTERFFGRDDAIALVLSKVETRAFTAVVAASGTGKSSLLLAGVIPKLGTKFSTATCRIGKEPDANPVKALARVLAPLYVEAPGQTTIMKEIRDLAAALGDGKLDLIDVLGTIFDRNDKPLRIIIDQFEELFTLADEAQRASFIAILSAALRSGSDPRFGIAITMRADFFGEALRYRELADLLQDNVVTIGPMTQDELKEAITKPANAVGVHLEGGLDQRLINDVGGRPGNLPLLQFALREMWDHMEGRRLDASSYDSIGGLATALAGRAEHIYSMIVESGEACEDIFRRLFTRLVVVARGQEPARRIAKANDLGEDAWRLAQRLAIEANRLVITDRQPDGTGTAEIVHEELARRWPRLAAWIEKDADFQLWRQQIEVQLATWGDHPDDEGGLLRGGMLSRGEEWHAKRSDDLSDVERRFVVESRRAADEEMLRELQRTEAIDRAESLRLAVECERLGDREPETALRLAWEALLWNRNELSESVFRGAVARIRAVTRELLPTHDGGNEAFGWGRGDLAWSLGPSGNGCLWSYFDAQCSEFGAATRLRLTTSIVPDGILVANVGGHLRLYDWEGELREETSLPGHDRDTLLDRDLPVMGTRGDGAGVVCIRNRVWPFRVNQGRIVLLSPIMITDAVPDIQHYRPFSVEVDPWADRFAIVGSHRTAHCFQFDGTLLGKLEPPDNGDFHEVLFLADGHLVGSELGGSGHIWTADGRLVLLFCDMHDGVDLFVHAVDRGGEHFATIRNRRGESLVVRDRSGNELARLPSGDVSIWSADFSADGTMIAVGSDDGSIRIWEWKTSSLRFRLDGHRRTVNRLLFHPTDSRRLLSRSHDNSLRNWLLAESVLPVLDAHRSEIGSIKCFGARIVSTDTYNTLNIVWEDTTAIETIPGAFIHASADGMFVTMIGATLSVRHLDTLTSRPLEITLPVVSPFAAVTSTTDGSRLAVVLSESSFSGLLYAADGTLVAQLVGGNVRSDRPLDRTPVGHGLTPDGSRFAAGCRGGAIWTWSGNGEPIAEWLAENYSAGDLLFDLQVDPLGDFILGGIRSEVVIWTWEGRELTRLGLCGYKTTKIAMDARGDVILTVSDNPSGRPSCFAELWSRAGQRIALLDAPELSYFPTVVFDPAGRYLLLQSGDLRIFDLDGELVDVLVPGRNQSIVAVAISADGNTAAALLNDGALRFWSAGVRRWTTPIETDATGPIAFTQDGQRLLVGHASGLIEQFPVSVHELFEGARERLTRGFDNLEIARFRLRTPPKLDIVDY